jgi:hypothetical protein
MSNKILFVFEGKTPEKHIVTSLKNYFLNENDIIECVFGAEIYQMYNEISNDEDLDTFSLIKNINDKNKIELKNYKRIDFSQIYLFFDYDGHSSKASDDDLIDMLDFFNEETEKGKLYLSYPMVESLRHYSENITFKDLIVSCKVNVNYKNIVHENGDSKYKQFSKYTIENWSFLISEHLKKMNFIVNDIFTLPENIYNQKLIFENQIEKFIEPSLVVSVLSAFPVFIHDYYGNKEIRNRISIED